VFNDWMSDCTSWDPVLPYFDVDRFTYALTDVRGYGRSIELKGRYDEKESAADTLQLVNHLGWSRFHLVGFSMTGMVVERLVIDVPERVKSVVAVCAVSAAGFKMPDELRQQCIDSITDDGRFRELLDVALGSRLSPQWKDFKFRSARATRRQDAARGYLEMFTRHDFSAEAGLINVPFLVICGRYDLPQERIGVQRETFSRWHKNIEFIEIESGHYPMQEMPVMLQTLMDGFMSRYA
jgi:3-oxoadipate enol-lactonase